jgi:hypothetical protein
MAQLGSERKHSLKLKLIRDDREDVHLWDNFHRCSGNELASFRCGKSLIPNPANYSERAESSGR